MNLNTIKPARGARTPAKRVGRGIGSGKGKTCGRGHKGQRARAGGFHKLGFEGGQMPLQRRLPKRGFTNALFKKEYEIVSLAQLAKAFETGDIVKSQSLVEKGLISPSTPRAGGFKVLASENFNKNLIVHAHAFSKSAQELIIKHGGQAHIIQEM